MADYTYYDRVITTREYRLNSPTNWAEVSKVFAAIKNEFPDKTYDDSVIIEGDEEGITICVELNDTGRKY